MKIRAIGSASSRPPSPAIPCESQRLLRTESIALSFSLETCKLFFAWVAIDEFCLVSESVDACSAACLTVLLAGSIAFCSMDRFIDPVYPVRKKSLCDLPAVGFSPGLRFGEFKIDIDMRIGSVGFQVSEEISFDFLRVLRSGFSGADCARVREFL
jgi:hypothetical protein